MVGNRPSGHAPPRSALPTTVESLAAWEANQRLLDADYAAQLAAAELRDQSAPAAVVPGTIVGQPPQLHHWMPGSQAIDEIGTAHAHAYPPALSTPVEPVQAPGAAAAAAGVPDADCVDNRNKPSTRGLPAPPPSGEVRDGSQTTWNLVPGLRQGGDSGVTKVRRLAPFGPNRFAPFDNSPFKIPTVSFESPPRPKPMTPPPPPSVPALPPASAAAASSHWSTPPYSAAGAPWTPAQPLAVGAPWTATQAETAPWTPAHGPGVGGSPGVQPAAAEEAEAAAAAAAAVAAACSPPPPSLAAAFPSPPPPRRRASGTNVGGGKKRSSAKAPSAKSGAPLAKKKKAAQEAARSCDGGTASNSAAPTPEAVAAWKLVGGEVAKAVRDGNKALWAALKHSTAQIEDLRADATRLEARVDAQGQCNERTALAVASVRLSVKGAASTEVPRKEASHGTCATGRAGVKDQKPVVKVEEAMAAAMALAPENEAEAAKLRRPLRTVVKKRVATTTDSREVLMDADTAVDVIQDVVVKAFVVSSDAANDYMMNRVYFPSSVKGAEPIKKWPVAVIMSTIPHTVAQLREFILKPFFGVLGFAYNPMPIGKANKWSKKDYFLTLYKGEKAVVAAAKNLFTKIGGSGRIVKDKSAGSRQHVEMVVGHHALIASFARNEFEIALGRRMRRRGGTGNGSYMHWLDEFAASIRHLSKHHKDNKVHAGYRITDAIDPDMVVRTNTGEWIFTAPGPAAANAPSSSTPVTSARPPTSTKRTVTASPGGVVRAGASAGGTARGGGPSGGAAETRRPAAGDPTAAPAPNCIEDYGVSVGHDGRAPDGDSHAPPAGVVIVVDTDADHGSGAALIGLTEEGAGSEAARSDGEGSRGGDSDSVESDEVGARTSSTDADDSDPGRDSSDDGDENAGLTDGEDRDEDEEEGVY